MGHGWRIIARFILKQRVIILLVIAGITAFMWEHRMTTVTQNLFSIVPPDDPVRAEYEAFKEEFGQEGTVLLIGFSGDILSPPYYNFLSRLSDTLKTYSGVIGVASLTDVVNITANQDSGRFEIQPIYEDTLRTQSDSDSLRRKLEKLPIYQDLFWNDSLSATVVLVSLDPQRMDTEEKIEIVYGIKAKTDYMLFKSGIRNARAHYAGLPSMRAFMNNFLPGEMTSFFGLAIFVLALTLFFFFRSLYAVIFPMLVIGVVVVWVVGLMGILGFEINIITAIIPSLVTVIGIPNCVYLLTKYHFEYKRTRNKVKSLILVIQKIGIVTVMTNATTAVGFVVLGFTNIRMLQEFGIVAGTSVLITFAISLLLIPIFFSFLPPPGRRQIKHTESRILRKVLKNIDFSVHNRRTIIYAFSFVLICSAIFGITKLAPVSYMGDDLPKNKIVYHDLKFLEKHFNGVMPFEIVINTHRKLGGTKLKYLKKIDALQDSLDKYDEISKPLSLVNVIKFSRQGLFGGGKDQYQLPTQDELGIIRDFQKGLNLKEALAGNIKMFDSTLTKLRITANVRDIGSRKLEPLIDSVEAVIEDLFIENAKSGKLRKGKKYRLYGDEDFSISYQGNTFAVGDTFVVDTSKQYSVLSGTGKIDFHDRYKVTGTTKLFVRGNSYLIRNLVQSLVIAFFVIALLMAMLFGSLRMVIIAIIPNFMPLLLVAGIMGIFGIALKPSTALIFSVAFGISVDDTIHFLARYRLARKTGDKIKVAVSNSFKDTGVSMIYTSIVLFFGFVIFSFSSFGGTEALGKLTSLTLLIALFSNLLLLPALLISFNRNSDQLGEGLIFFEEEQEDVEAFKELYRDNGDDDEDSGKNLS